MICYFHCFDCHTESETDGLLVACSNIGCHTPRSHSRAADTTVGVAPRLSQSRVRLCAVVMASIVTTTRLTSSILSNRSIFQFLLVWIWANVYQHHNTCRLGNCIVMQSNKNSETDMKQEMNGRSNGESARYPWAENKQNGSHFKPKTEVSVLLSIAFQAHCCRISHYIWS